MDCDLFPAGELSPASSDHLSKLAVLFIFAGTVLVDYLNSVTGASNFRLIFAAGAVLCLAVSARARSLLNERDRLVRNLVVVIVFFSALGPFVWTDFRMSNYYLCILTALVLYRLDYRLFLKAAMFLLAANVILQCWEYWSQQYIYTYVTKDGQELTESLMSGATNLFRAKGIFPSPKTAGDFGIGIALLSPNSFAALALAFVAATLANDRLTILSVAAMVVLNLYAQMRPRTKARKRMPGSPSRRRYLLVALAFVVLLSGFTYWFYSQDLFALDRLLQSWDADNSQNISRTGFWLDGISFYSEYDLVHKLLGNLGSWTQQTSFGSAESDWLTLLMDTGILGCSIYALSFLYLAYLAWERDRILLAYLAIPWLISATNPYILAPIGGVLYWAFLLRANDHLRRLQVNPMAARVKAAGTRPGSSLHPAT